MQALYTFKFISMMELYAFCPFPIYYIQRINDTKLGVDCRSGLTENSP